MKASRSFNVTKNIRVSRVLVVVVTHGGSRASTSLLRVRW